MLGTDSVRTVIDPCRDLGAGCENQAAGGQRDSIDVGGFHDVNVFVTEVTIRDGALSSQGFIACVRFGACLFKSVYVGWRP